MQSLYAACLYVLVTAGVIVFQGALVLGAPLGRFTQGGRYQGVLPLPARIAAGLSILLLAVMALAMVSAVGLWPFWPRPAYLALLAFLGLSVILNLITPSKPERMVFGPIAVLMLALALVPLLTSRAGPPAGP